MSKSGMKFLYLLFSASLLLCVSGCQSEKQDSSVVENVAQMEETVDVEAVEKDSVKEDLAQSNMEETVFPNQPEVTEEPIESDIIKNDFFSVCLDSMTVENENVVMTFIFTNVSDISYYKGDEEYQPGDSWEKIIRFTKDKWESFDNAYLHYKLCDASIYDEDVKVYFSGGARFEMDENLNILVLEIFEDAPVDTE